MKTENRHATIAIACAFLMMSAPAFAQRMPDVSRASDSQALLARFENVTEADLKTQYLLCSRVSSQRLLTMGEAVVCSMVGEVLKVRSFGGDFDALIAWWRLHRDEALAAAADGG